MGSYATPALIDSGTPDPWILFTYLLAVTFACFFTAHLRQWRRLAMIASIAADLWGLLWLATEHASAQHWPVAVYVVGLTACTLLLLHREETANAPVPPEAKAWPWAEFDLPVSWLLAGHALVALILSLADQLAAPSLWGVIALSLMLGGAAWSWRSLAFAPAIAAVTVVLSYIGAHEFFVQGNAILGGQQRR